MIRHIFLLLVFAAVACFGAQGSGMYFEAHASQGKMSGDKLYNFEGPAIGSIIGDSIHYIKNGKEGTDKNTYTQLSSYPVDYQYAVQYSFTAGYEKSFSRVLSIRAALGYQKALLDAYAATIPGYFNGDMTEVPFVSATIVRHWLIIPIDFKATLPIRRGGLYLAVGPKTSILLSSKHTDSLSDNLQDLSGLTPRFNLGLGFRFGAELSIANAGYLFIESGFHRGLVNTSPISSANTQESELALLGIGFRMDFTTKGN
jgi:hypothetical protein